MYEDKTIILPTVGAVYTGELLIDWGEMSGLSDKERMEQEEQKAKLIDQVLELQTTLDGSAPSTLECFFSSLCLPSRFVCRVWYLAVSHDVIERRPW